MEKSKGLFKKRLLYLFYFQRFMEGNNSKLFNGNLNFFKVEECKGSFLLPYAMA
jgi:hypothetical protein